MIWLIEDFSYDGEVRKRLQKAAFSLGHETKVVKYIPFNEDKLDFGIDEEKQPVVFFGSINMVKFINRYYKYLPGTWVDFDKLKMTNYLQYFGDYMIHTDYAFLPLSEIRRNLDNVYEHYCFCPVQGQLSNPGNKIFIRPDSNDKGFTGEVVHKTLWQDFDKHLQGNQIAPNTLCMVSRPTTIFQEWRLVVTPTSVVSGSQYRLNGDVHLEAGYPKELGTFCAEVLSHCQFDCPLYTIDFALTPDGYKIVEIGGFNSAGLYECDMMECAKVASDIAQKEWDSVYV